jgi:anti-sigma regulatory factor (Ser/Thr protein kinase)
MAARFPVPFEWDVEPAEEHVVAARRLIAEIAAFWRLPLSVDAMRDVDLVAGELIANAVRHTKARCRVTLHFADGRLRLEVWDASLRLPEPRRAATEDLDGRGLALVEAFAYAWGWQPSGAGKVVWAEVAADQLPAASRSAAQLAHAPAA